MVFLGNFLQEHGYPGAICSKQDHLISAVGRQATTSETEVAEEG